MNFIWKQKLLGEIHRLMVHNIQEVIITVSVKLFDVSYRNNLTILSNNS